MDQNNTIVILINLDANGGRAFNKWHRIKSEILRTLPDQRIITEYHLPFDMHGYLEEHIHHKKIRTFILGGGDGTINYFLNTLSEVVGKRDLSNYLIGGIGLGSSNDFTKPLKNQIKGIPLKINMKDSCYSDIGQVEIVGPELNKQRRLFVINASLGITSKANHLYNHPDKVLNFLKRNFTVLSIMYTAIISIVKYKNQNCLISWNGHKKSISLSNLSITKIPFISGSFHYKKGYNPLSNSFDIFICHDMSKALLIATLYNLTKGVFKNGINSIIDEAEKIQIKSDHIISIETDGEVNYGTAFNFSVLPMAIQLMS